MGIIQLQIEFSLIRIVQNPKIHILKVTDRWKLFSGFEGQIWPIYTTYSHVWGIIWKLIKNPKICIVQFSKILTYRAVNPCFARCAVYYSYIRIINYYQRLFIRSKMPEVTFLISNYESKPLVSWFSPAGFISAIFSRFGYNVYISDSFQYF